MAQRRRVPGTDHRADAAAAAVAGLRRSPATLALLLSLQDGFAVYGLDGTVLEVNRRLCEMTGFAYEELVGALAPFPYWPEEELEVIRAHTCRLRDHGHSEADLVFKRRDGMRFPVIVNSSVLRDDEGEPVAFVATFKDITARKQAEERVHELAREHAALARVAAAVAHERDPAEIFALVAEEAGVLFDMDGAGVARFDGDEALIMSAWGSSGTSLALAGRRFPLTEGTASAIVNTSGRPARVGRDAPGSGDVARELTGVGVLETVAAPVVVAGAVWGSISVARTTDEPIAAGVEERLGRFAELVSLAIANAEERQRLADRAERDALTGLLNHRAFHERVGQAFATARDQQSALSLVLFDLDRFKAINDTQGHQAGDRVLAKVAAILAAQAGAGDSVGRVGGDELAWLQPGADATQALAAAERARAAVAAERLELPGGAHLTLSAGICEAAHAGHVGDLVRLADGALYWAKANGRDMCIGYTPAIVDDLSPAERIARLERSQALTSIRVLARAVDAKDPSTQRHSERVAELAGHIATALGWTLEDTAALRDAGLVHDVGKIGIPDAILLKPTRLTAQEYAQIKDHAMLGARIVSGVLLAEQVAWVRHHHERWDGRGYPDGLAGAAIPAGACILGVADAWDAMRMERSYQDARTVDDALRECVAHAGTQFCPDVVRALGSLARAGALD